MSEERDFYNDSMRTIAQDMRTFADKMFRPGLKSVRTIRSENLKSVKSPAFLAQMSAKHWRYLEGCRSERLKALLQGGSNVQT